MATGTTWRGSSRSRGAVVRLPTGAEARRTNAGGRRAVVLVDGGRAAEVPGTWSATLEWLVARLGPRFPELAFLDVKYRVKSWRRLDLCVEDALAAIELALESGADACALVGFSMGGAVAIRAAAHPAVTTVVGLAPWLPDRLDLSPLVGKRFVVVHGLLDRSLLGVPGVRPGESRRGYERARSLGVVDAEYAPIAGGLHGTAVRAPWGLVALPRARRWADALAGELERFAAADAPSTP